MEFNIFWNGLNKNASHHNPGADPIKNLYSKFTNSFGKLDHFRAIKKNQQ